MTEQKVITFSQRKIVVNTKDHIFGKYNEQFLNKLFYLD